MVILYQIYILTLALKLEHRLNMPKVIFFCSSILNFHKNSTLFCNHIPGLLKPLKARMAQRIALPILTDPIWSVAPKYPSWQAPCGG